MRSPQRARQRQPLPGRRRCHPQGHWAGWQARDRLPAGHVCVP